MQAYTTTNPALPAGSYDVVCWFDKDGDNTLSPGDYTGTAFNYSLSAATGGAAFVYPSVTLAPH
jgi:hypothetical protein